jgi:hypothetical protein
LHLTPINDTVYIRISNMKKRTKRVPRKFARLVGRNKIVALTVVLFCVSVGGFVLPNLFAQTGPLPVAMDFAGHPDNAPDYGVVLTWKGYTPDHWTIRGSGTTLQVRGTTKTITGLRCNQSYAFEIAAADAGNIIKGPWTTTGSVVECAGVAVSLGTVSGNVIPVHWSRSSSVTTTYSVYAVSGGAMQTVVSGTASQSGTVNFTGKCGTAYSFYGVAAAVQNAVSATVSAATAACPPAAPPASSNNTTSPKPSGGSSAPTSKPKTVTKSSSPSIAAVPAGPPTAPANFAATVTSSKIVSLKWDNTGGADHYVISRSTDQTNWSELTDPTGSEQSYTDDSAAFSATYYYQITAVGADGQKSPPATTQITTTAFKSSSDQLISPDKSVVVAIPDGAIGSEYDCALNADQDDSSSQPSGQAMILGPYSLLCVTEDGATVHTFNKPVTVTMKLASVATGYQDFTGYGVVNGSWSAVKDAQYAPDGQQLSFTLTKAQTFAAFGKEQGSTLGGVIVTILLLLLFSGAVVFVLWWRRRSGSSLTGLGSTSSGMSLPPAAVTAAAPAGPLPLTAEQEFRKAVSQPDCSHLGMAQQVIPSSQGCLECERDHTRWNALRICLVCGHVGCSDDSPEQHAFKHFRETGHPIIYEYSNPSGNTIGWCYIDQTYI